MPIADRLISSVAGGESEEGVAGAQCRRIGWTRDDSDDNGDDNSDNISDNISDDNDLFIINNGHGDDDDDDDDNNNNSNAVVSSDADGRRVGSVVDG